MRESLEDSAQRAIRYLEGLEGRSVTPGARAIEDLSAFKEPFPESPADPGLVLQMLDEFGSPATMAMAGSRFFGFVIGGSLPAALAANRIAGALDHVDGAFGLWADASPPLAHLVKGAP